ncbi:MAG: phosphatidylserine decarboxylase, partial [Oscillospiraceae bacterium]
MGLSYRVSVKRKGSDRTGGEKSAGALRFLYRTAPGRLVLKAAVRPAASRLGGRILSSRISSLRIKHFIRKSGIDMSEYPERRWRSFNDFFTRSILPERRPIDMEPSHLISPCDARLSAYIIGKDSVIPIKGCNYTVRELLQNERLARQFEGGYCLVFRLSVSDYHRYCYIDNAV